MGNLKIGDKIYSIKIKTPRCKYYILGMVIDIME